MPKDNKLNDSPCTVKEMQENIKKSMSEDLCKEGEYKDNHNEIELCEIENKAKNNAKKSTNNINQDEQIVASIQVEHSCYCEQHKHNNKKQDRCCHNSSDAHFDCCCPCSHHSSCDCCEAQISKKDMRLKLIFLTISAVMLVLSFIDFWTLIALPQINFLDFGYIAIALCAYPIFANAFKSLSKGKITSQLLVSLAIVASIVLEIVCRCSGIVSNGHSHSYIFVAGEVSFLMTLGGLIETWTLKSSRKGIERIVNMSPKTANIKVNDEIKTVKISEIKLGDIVVVRPNEMIPVDGEVISGSSAVDESSVTGEFVPVDVEKGNVVYGATWNKMGAIEIKVTKETKDMTVNKLIHLALEAEDSKAPIAKLVDKFASWLVPCIVVVSILVGVLTYFVGKITWVEALIRSVTILVVFCPCSLTLSTPTAIAASIGSGAYNGIIIKSGDALERLAGVNTIAFDKTGTITVGNIQVKEVISFGKLDSNELLKLTASAEKYSEHPIGKAIVEYSKGKIKLIEPKKTCSQVGVGIEAQVGEDKVKVLSLEKAKENFKDNKDLLTLNEYLEKGYTIVVTIKNDTVIGALCLYDTIREDAVITMEKLKEMKIDTLMLTGDNINSANNIANTCHIDNVKASLMPEDKVREIKDLKENGKTVCMIGDGVNDAPALATSDCSIALSAIGNDVAVETADIAIMNSDIKNIYNTVMLSKKTLRTIKGNIIVSMIINIMSVLATFFGFLNPASGAIVHTLSSIFVILNSAFLLRTKYFKSDNKDKKITDTQTK